MDSRLMFLVMITGLIILVGWDQIEKTKERKSKERVAVINHNLAIARREREEIRMKKLKIVQIAPNKY